MRARVAEGVLLCEDEADALVRSEADRDLRSVDPRSVTDEAMLCLLLACLRRGGVAASRAGNSYWSSWRGGVFSPGLAAGVMLSWGGARVEFVCLCPCPLVLPPKNEGRREKRPWLELSAMLVAHVLSQRCGATERSGAVSPRTLITLPHCYTYL